MVTTNEKFAQQIKTGYYFKKEYEAEQSEFLFNRSRWRNAETLSGLLTGPRPQKKEKKVRQFQHSIPCREAAESYVFRHHYRLNNRFIIEQWGVVQVGRLTPMHIYNCPNSNINRCHGRDQQDHPQAAI
jgi:hypothetical protein